CAIARNRTDMPQPLDCRACRSHAAYIFVARRMIEHQNVLGDRRAGEALFCGRRGERRLQRADRREVELAVAPLHDLERLERMRLERLHQLGLERRTAPGGAECAVTRRAAGAASDLCKFRGIEPAELITVEFAV